MQVAPISLRNLWTLAEKDDALARHGGRPLAVHGVFVEIFPMRREIARSGSSIPRDTESHPTSKNRKP